MRDVQLEFLGRRDKPPFYLTKAHTTLGRGADNDVVFCEAEEDRVVSVRHCRMELVDGACRVFDLGASNKLLVNDEPVTEWTLADGDILQLGKQGPRLRVTLGSGTAPKRGLVAATQLVLRERLGARKYRVAVVALGVLCAGLVALYVVTKKDQLEGLENLRSRLEASIAGASSAEERMRLIGRLNRVVLEREKLLASLPEDKRPKRSFVEEQVISLMVRFHETSYLVPALFVQRVEGFVRYYTEDPRGRQDVLLGLRNAKALLPTLRATLREKKLPPELAYVAFVESKFDAQAHNTKTDARGLWQLLPLVAKGHGLQVTASLDERTDPMKSTLAARALMLELVATYGVRSFMLVLAAYNAGDASIRFRLKKLENPIEQRDFWTLVRLGLLREETNSYIPKFIAATIVFENLSRFGFTGGGFTGGGFDDGAGSAP